MEFPSNLHPDFLLRVDRDRRSLEARLAHRRPLGRLAALRIARVFWAVLAAFAAAVHGPGSAAFAAVAFLILPAMAVPNKSDRRRGRLVRAVRHSALADLLALRGALCSVAAASFRTPSPVIAEALLFDASMLAFRSGRHRFVSDVQAVPAPIFLRHSVRPPEAMARNSIDPEFPEEPQFFMEKGSGPLPSFAGCSPDDAWLAACDTAALDPGSAAEDLAAIWARAPFDPERPAPFGKQATMDAIAQAKTQGAELSAAARAAVDHSRISEQGAAAALGSPARAKPSSL